MNAKKELLDHIGGKAVDLVRIKYQKDYSSDPVFIEGELDDVLPLLDFQYHDGFGSQELFGYIWYADGTWSERHEYDGAECWEHKECPPKDIELRG